MSAIIIIQLKIVFPISNSSKDRSFIACVHLKQSKRNVESFLEVQDQYNQTAAAGSQHLKASENKKTKRPSISFHRNNKEEVSSLLSNKSALSKHDVCILFFNIGIVV